MREQTGFIYRITNRVNGKIYIGQTSRSVSERWNQHLYHARKGKQYPIYSAIRKHGAESFQVEILCETQWIFLDSLEEFFIVTNRSLLSQNGYNVTPGGDGLGRGEQSPNFGRKYSAEQRANISKSRKGLKFTPEHKANLSKALGVHNAHSWTKESRSKLSESRKGILFSDEHRNKLKKARARQITRKDERGRYA